ncbi:MAG: MFS transporter [Carbonactinosporaceae bacterium]
MGSVADTRREGSVFKRSTRATGRGVRQAARGTWRTAARTASATGTGARTFGRGVRRATSAQGAGESGLAKLIELHAVNYAGDTLIALALANTLFFNVPVGEARGRVALYLLVSMAPFVLVAPVIGPVLDRLRAGRRYALATTFLMRAFLCWVMAGAITTEAIGLYPAAFGVLVASKAYGVTRSAVVPRLLPGGVSLVRANGRISLAGIAGAAVAAPIGAGLGLLGPEWTLRFGFAVFAVGMVLALMLPARVDSPQGEVAADLGEHLLPHHQRFRSIGPFVVAALRANAMLRAFSGFLTFFLAFLMRGDPVAGMNPMTAIGAVVVAAAVGSTSGMAIGAWLRARAPEAVVTAVLAAASCTAVVATVFYGLVTVLATALVAGLAQTLGKVALDAILQRDVPEGVRTSAFARTETVLQLTWVIGGAVGIALPLNSALGLGLASAALVAILVVSLRTLGGPRLREPPSSRPRQPQAR